MLLIGIPLLRSYFTKDLILESIRNKRGWLIEILLYRTLILSFYYSLKLFNFTCRNSAINAYKLYNKINITLTILIIIIFITNLFIFKLIYNLLWLDYLTHTPTNFVNKIIPFLLLFFTISIWLKINSFIYLNHKNYFYFNNIFGLKEVTKNILIIFTCYFANETQIIESWIINKQLIETQKLFIRINEILLKLTLITNIFRYTAILILGILFFF